MNYLQKNYLKRIKTGRNDSKFTIGKYRIHTMEIIKLILVNICVPETKFPYLKILLFCRRSSFRIFDQFRGLFKQTKRRNWGKNRREITRMFTAAKFCHQVTWARQKDDLKEN